MSSNPLMMGYEGGDLLLAGAACDRLLGHCMQAVRCDLLSWRRSFSDEKRVRGVYTRDALYKSMCYLFLLYLSGQ